MNVGGSRGREFDQGAATLNGQNFNSLYEFSNQGGHLTQFGQGSQHLYQPPYTNGDENFFRGPPQASQISLENMAKLDRDLQDIERDLEDQAKKLKLPINEVDEPVLELKISEQLKMRYKEMRSSKEREYDMQDEEEGVSCDGASNDGEIE